MNPNAVFKPRSHVFHHCKTLNSSSSTQQAAKKTTTLRHKPLPLSTPASVQKNTIQVHHSHVINTIAHNLEFFGISQSRIPTCLGEWRQMGLYSWFQRQPQQVEDLQSDVASYTMEEVGCHNTRNDIWMVIHGKVYDVTGFLCKHPGGIEVLLDCAGVDATAYFDDVGHSEDSKLMLTPLYKGEIIGNKVLNEKHSSVGTKGYRWFPFMLDFRDYADSFNFVDSLQKHELVKRKRQRPLYVYKNKGYIILAIVAVLSALGFFHLQQRKWH